MAGTFLFNKILPKTRHPRPTDRGDDVLRLAVGEKLRFDIRASGAATRHPHEGGDPENGVVSSIG